MDLMNMLHLFNAGGLVMYPLLFCSIMVVAIGIERIRFFSNMKSDMDMLIREVADKLDQKQYSELEEVLERDGGIPALVIKEALEKFDGSVDQGAVVEGSAIHGAAQLRQYINYLEVIVTLSPLLGLLGTVIGMIGSFSVLSVSEGQPFAITAGVGEALIATATGLLVAILALVVHTYLAQRLDILVSDMEKLSSVYLAHIRGARHEA